MSEKRKKRARAKNTYYTIHTACNLVHPMKLACNRVRSNEIKWNEQICTNYTLFFQYILRLTEVSFISNINCFDRINFNARWKDSRHWEKSWLTPVNHNKSRHFHVSLYGQSAAATSLAFFRATLNDEWQRFARWFCSSLFALVGSFRKK